MFSCSQPRNQTSQRYAFQFRSRSSWTLRISSSALQRAHFLGSTWSSPLRTRQRDAQEPGWSLAFHRATRFRPAASGLSEVLACPHSHMIRNRQQNLASGTTIWYWKPSISVRQLGAGRLGLRYRYLGVRSLRVRCKGIVVMWVAVCAPVENTGREMSVR